jgi:hypothetical protein
LSAWICLPELDLAEIPETSHDFSATDEGEVLSEVHDNALAMTAVPTSASLFMAHK